MANSVNADAHLLMQMAKSGDAAACSKLVQDNMGLVWSVVKRFYGRGYEADDLFQTGCIGLIKAVNRFEPSYNFQFSTYAVSMIIGEIKRFIRDDGLIKVSRSLKEIYIKYKVTKENIVKETGKEPTISEMAKHIGVSSEDLIMAMEANRPTEWLQSTSEDKDGNTTLLVDKISNNKGRGHECLIIDKIAIKQAIAKLDIKEKQIILLRYFKQYTQSKVAKLMGISQVQVSRIESRVLKNIRQKLKS